MPSLRLSRIFLTTLLLTHWSFSALAQSAAQPQPASLAGFADKGVFLLFLNEERIATVTFEWQPDGTFSNRATLPLAGQTVTTTTKIVPDKERRWVNITLESPQGAITTVRDGDLARRTFKEKVETVTLKPDAVLFGNYDAALMSQAVRLYD